MIKLIASDIDGTLLPEGSDKLNPEMYTVIRMLKERGTLFAAASGRSYPSIARLFAPVKDDMIFIADNGSNVVCRGYETFSAVLNRRDTEELVYAMRKRGDCTILLSSKTTVYLETEDEQLLDLLINGYHNNVRVCKDVLDQEDSIVKAAIYYRPGIQKIAGPIIEEWKDRFHVMAAGDPWLDFVDYRADKGKALESIQELLKISREETMAFGDNLNDLGMLARAEESYAVANARPEVRAAAKHQADSNLQDGVLKIMRRLLEEEKNVQ
ncbi:MAG: HAD family hydrolase [Candidatus Limivivens sp.]|nr:HAD family hydrolase [Candidatus Limivivens sp.]